jgi:hypothetical protein
MTMLRNRVKEMRMVRATDLVAHEANWRTHSPASPNATMTDFGVVSRIQTSKTLGSFGKGDAERTRHRREREGFLVCLAGLRGGER